MSRRAPEFDKATRRRILRTAVAMAGLLLLSAGCGNFSISGILDNPPGDAGGFKLLPDAVNVPINGAKQFLATGGMAPYAYSVDDGRAGGTIDTSGIYRAPTLPETDSVVATDAAGSISVAMAYVLYAVPLSLTPISTNVNAGGSGWNGSSWTLAVGDRTNRVGTYTSLRLDQFTGKARIAYYDATAQDLKYAKEN